MTKYNDMDWRRLGKLLDTLTEMLPVHRQKIIIKRCVLGNVSMTYYARKWHISRQMIRKIRTRALNNLNKQFKGLF